jgi:hypothetical protein
VNDVLESAGRLLSITTGRWQSLVDAAPRELLERTPAPGEWSAADCLHHLLVTEREVFGFRLRAILEGRDLVVFDPNERAEEAPGWSPSDAVSALVAEREANLAILTRLSPADLERTGRHPEHGTVTLAVVINTWVGHDLQHTVQAEEALMQAFLPGTGPFRFRFAAHEAQP